MTKQHELATRIAFATSKRPKPDAPVPSFFKLRPRYASLLAEMAQAGRDNGIGTTKTDLVELGIELLSLRYQQVGIVRAVMGNQTEEGS